MKKKIGIFVISMLLLFVFTSCGNGENSDGSGSGSDATKTEPTYTMKFSAQAAVDYPTTVSAQRAADKIFEETNGDVLIKVYPSSELGDYVSVYEEVMRGTIDLANLSIPSQFDPRLEMNYIPYLVTNYADLEKIYMPGTYFWNIYAPIHEELGVTLLNITMDGFMGIGAAKLDTSNLTDFNSPRNNLLRVPSMEIFANIASAMNYPTTSIPYAELYPALQTGVADGWFGGNSYINYSGFADAISIFVDYRYLMENIGTVMNAETLSALPEDYQQIIRTTFAEEGKRSFTEIEAVDQEGIDKLRDAGKEIVQFSDEEFDTIAEQMRDKTWPKLNDKFGEDVMNGLRNSIEK